MYQLNCLQCDYINWGAPPGQEFQGKTSQAPDQGKDKNMSDNKPHRVSSLPSSVAALLPPVVSLHQLQSDFSRE